MTQHRAPSVHQQELCLLLGCGALLESRKGHGPRSQLGWFGCRSAQACSGTACPAQPSATQPSPAQPRGKHTQPTPRRLRAALPEGRDRAAFTSALRPLHCCLHFRAEGKCGGRRWGYGCFWKFPHGAPSAWGFMLWPQRQAACGSQMGCPNGGLVVRHRLPALPCAPGHAAAA